MTQDRTVAYHDEQGCCLHPWPPQGARCCVCDVERPCFEVIAEAQPSEWTLHRRLADLEPLNAWTASLVAVVVAAWLREHDQRVLASQMLWGRA